MSYVKTSNPTQFDDQEREGVYFVTSPTTRRTFGSHSKIIDHATNFIQRGDCDEFLIVKVVGRIKKRPVPVEYVKIEN